MSLSRLLMKSTSFKQRRKFYIVGILGTIILLLYLLVTNSMKGLIFPTILPNTMCVFKKSLIQEDITFLYSELVHLHRAGNAPVATLLVKVEHMMESLGIPIPKELFQDNTEMIKQMRLFFITFDVCPEKFMGTKYGYLYYVTGWVMENCLNVRPIEEVITILLNPLYDHKCPDTLEQIITGIRSNYSRVQILIPDDVIPLCSPKVIASVNKVIVGEKWPPGRKWNVLLNAVTTPYVFIGRNLENFIGWLARLERQIRIFSLVPSVQIVGGSVRNRTGHWRVGCYQLELKNYVLTYQEGYYASRNECMYCDYVLGPFVAKTELFKSIPFTEYEDTRTMFDDFFLRVKRSSHLIMNCPDVMNFALDDDFIVKESQRRAWFNFIRTWDINRIVLPNNRVLGFSCKESDIACKRFSTPTNTFLIPPCCIEQYAKSITIFHEFCVKNNIYYEFDASSVLGLVKVSDYLPWASNGYVNFYANNYTFFKNAVNYFEQDEMNLTDFNHEKDNLHFKYLTPDFQNNFYGKMNLSKDLYEPEIFRNNPTKARLHGTWVYAPISPGLYARNYYGDEMLHHTNNWVQKGFKTSREIRSSLQFTRCRNPKHQACLDQILTDGNLQFKIPQPN